MGQINLIRTQFIAREVITSLSNTANHTLAFTGYYLAGDVVDVLDIDVNGNVLSTLASNLTIVAINPNTSIVLSAAVDTSAAVGTPVLSCQIIDDGQEAIDRLYRKTPFSATSMDFDLREDILFEVQNSPIVGQTTYSVANTAFWRAGDTFDVLADEGLIGSGNVVSVNVNADAANNLSTIVIDTVLPFVSGYTNPFILDTSITTQQAIERNQERIDGIDTPIENEYMGVGDGALCAFRTSQLFVQNTSKLLMDGKRLRLGTPGTRAALTQGAGNSQLLFTSMLLGLLGNEVEVRVVSGAGYTVAVTKTFFVTGAGSLTGSLYRVTVNDNGGAGTALAIANAINTNATARSIVQARYGGTGLGVVATFGPTALTGGLDNGTGDYAEIEQVYNNLLTATGFQWVSLHIRRNEVNRLHKPPQDDEEMCIDYRRATENI
jgi:hypothetical protein